VSDCDCSGWGSLSPDQLQWSPGWFKYKLKCTQSIDRMFLCVSGQSVHLGMGGSWSRAVPCHLWTLCHILPGFLYILLHWRVSRKTTKPSTVSLEKHDCSLTLTTTFDGWFLAVLSLLFSRGFAVTLLYGKINSEKHLEKCEHSYLPPTQIGILKVKARLTTRAFWPRLHKQMN